MDTIINHDLPIITQSKLTMSEEGNTFSDPPQFEFYSDIDGYRMLTKDFDLQAIISDVTPIYFHMNPYCDSSRMQQQHLEKLQYHGVTNLGEVQTLPFLSVGNIDVLLMWDLNENTTDTVFSDEFISDILPQKKTKVNWLSKVSGGDAIIEWFYSTLLSRLPAPHQIRYAGINNHKKPLLLNPNVWNHIQQTAADIWHEAKWNLPEFFHSNEPKLFISYFGQKDTNYKLPSKIFDISKMKCIWLAVANTAALKNYTCCWKRTWIQDELHRPTIYRVGLTQSMASEEATSFASDSISEPLHPVNVTKVLMYGEYSYPISNIFPSNPPGPYNGTPLNHTILHSLGAINDTKLAKTLSKEVKQSYNRITSKVDENAVKQIVDTMKNKTFGARTELTILFCESSVEEIEEQLNAIQINFKGIYK